MLDEIYVDGEPRLKVALVYVRWNRCVVDPLWLMFAEAGSA